MKIKSEYIFLYSRMVGMANMILGMLKRRFESKDLQAVKIAICSSSKGTFGVCCASVESSHARRHYQN